MRTPYKAPKGLLTRAQAARYLGVSDWKLIQLVRNRAMVEIKDKGVFTYRVTDIEALATSMFPSLKEN